MTLLVFLSREEGNVFNRKYRGTAMTLLQPQITVLFVYINSPTQKLSRLVNGTGGETMGTRGPDHCSQFRRCVDVCITHRLPFPC
jgi:hypothetical protein